MKAVGFSRETADRLVDLLDADETSPDEGGFRRRPSRDLYFVKITSTSQTDDRYPGTWYLYNTLANTFSSQSNVWVVEVNGESLETGTYYPAIRAGVANSRPVWLVSSGGITSINDQDGSTITLGVGSTGSDVRFETHDDDVTIPVDEVRLQVPNAGYVSSVVHRGVVDPDADQVLSIGGEDSESYYAQKDVVFSNIACFGPLYSGGAEPVVNLTSNLGTHPGPVAGQDWDDATAYVEDDLVFLDNDVYVCILAHTNQEPPNATYWARIYNPAGIEFAKDPNTLGNPGTYDVFVDCSVLDDFTSLGTSSSRGYLTLKSRYRNLGIAYVVNGVISKGATGTDAVGNVFEGGVCFGVNSTPIVSTGSGAPGGEGQPRQFYWDSANKAFYFGAV